MVCGYAWHPFAGGGTPACQPAPAPPLQGFSLAHPVVVSVQSFSLCGVGGMSATLHGPPERRVLPGLRVHTNKRPKHYVVRSPLCPLVLSPKHCRIESPACATHTQARHTHPHTLTLRILPISTGVLSTLTPLDAGWLAPSQSPPPSLPPPPRYTNVCAYLFSSPTCHLSCCSPMPGCKRRARPLRSPHLLVGPLLVGLPPCRAAGFQSLHTQRLLASGTASHPLPASPLFAGHPLLASPSGASAHVPL